MNRANPTGHDDSDDWCGDVELPARDGWKVTFFYDCGELDYIDHFITPSGEKLEVWSDEYQTEHLPAVMCWRSMGDLARLKDGDWFLDKR